MNKRIRNFFTLTRRANDGFTLVELIVVIAILAILAGVAVPAYSGYLDKANRAGDETLLAAVNKAYASACLEAGYDRNFDLNATTAKIRLAADSTVDLTKIEPANVQESFATYFAGNEGAQFKVMKDFVYVNLLGMFVPIDEAGNVEVSYGGATLKIPQAYIDLVTGSTFLTKESLGGTDGLLDKIADVSDFASAFIGTGGNAGDLLTGVTSSPEFLAFAAQSLGIDPTDTDAFIAKDKELVAAMREKYPEYASLSDGELYNKYMTNAAVLYAANNATQMSREDIMASLTNSDVKQNIIDTKATDTTTAFSQATLAYGMYTAWAHASGNTEAQGKDELDVMNDLNNEAFQAWLKTPEAEADLDAYLAALSIVNSSTKDSGAVSDVLVNGFNDPNLKDAVGGLFPDENE